MIQQNILQVKFCEQYEKRPISSMVQGNDVNVLSEDVLLIYLYMKNPKH